MKIPQILYIAINAIGFGIKLEESRDNPNMKMLPTVLACAIEFGLLWWGGFFS